jgi:hypothetical protein
MIAPDAVGNRDRTINPKQIARTIRAMVVALAIFCATLGGNLVNLTRTIARHNSYDVALTAELGLIGLWLAIIAAGIAIHVSLQRLVRSAEHG